MKNLKEFLFEAIDTKYGTITTGLYIQDSGSMSGFKKQIADFYKTVEEDVDALYVMNDKGISPIKSLSELSYDGPHININKDDIKKFTHNMNYIVCDTSFIRFQENSDAIKEIAKKRPSVKVFIVNADGKEVNMMAKKLFSGEEKIQMMSIC